MHVQRAQTPLSSASELLLKDDTKKGNKASQKHVQNWLRPTTGFRRHAFNGSRWNNMCVLCDKCAVRLSCCLPAEGDKRNTGAAVRIDRDRRREGRGERGEMGWGGARSPRCEMCKRPAIRTLRIAADAPRPCTQECGQMGGRMGGWVSGRMGVWVGGWWVGGSTPTWWAEGWPGWVNVNYQEG